MSEKIVRIGGASGYWGDTSSAPRQLVEKGDIHYLVFDYLAEVTMSILAKLRSRSEEAGYAVDFVTAAMKPLIGEIARRKIKVIANAGGVNLPACRKALEKVAQEAGVTLKIGVVEGDDLMPRLTELRGANIREMQSGAPLPEKILSANAYLGAFPIAAALAAGADIVITGRCVDSALVLGPLIHEFGWKAGDFDRLAAGSLAGHLLECGAQVTGGNFTDWREVADGWDDMGFPIAAVKADGAFVVEKPAGTGGLVSPLTVGEQLLYEIGDPKNYILPDVTCDFSGVRLIQEGRDRVRVEGVRGRAPSATYKVSATWPGGFSSIGTMTVAGFEAAERARRNGEAILKKSRKMLADASLGDYRRANMNVIGAETLYGANARAANEAREVVLRLAIHHDKNEGAELFSREFVGSGLSMATGRCGIAAGRPNVSPVVRLYSFLINKDKVPITVSVDGKSVAYSPAKIAAATEAPAKKEPDVAQALPPGRRIEVPLVKLAVARSGDKGNDANIGVMARRAEYLPAIRAALTSAAVKTYFAHYAEGPIERYDLPGLHALNFVLRDSLGGGGTSSTNLDTQAKTYAQLLLAFPVQVPEAWGNELGAAG
jgi:acyclic terpene utilization AtuA family protein